MLLERERQDVFAYDYQEALLRILLIELQRQELEGGMREARPALPSTVKMENDIVAPQDGTVKQIVVSKGASVDTDAVLAVI